MRLIHTADVHLDSKPERFLDAQEAKNRKAEIMNTFSRMVAFASEHDVNGILISGDLFDTTTVSKTASNMVKKEIESHPQLQFFYLRGNHDAKGFLEAFETMPKNLHTFGDTWKTYSSGNVTITGVELSDKHPEIYDTLTLDPGKINIVMMHGQETEVQGKNDAEVIRLRELRDHNIDYLALGHIHAKKAGKLDSRGVYAYSGCLEGRGFDETGEKGFILLEIDEEKKEIERKFVPFAMRTVHHVDVDTTGLLSTADVILKIREELSSRSIEKKDLVEVLLTGSYDAENELDQAQILVAFKFDYYVFKLKTGLRLTVDYSVYENDCSLKGEFIRLVKADPSMTEDEKAEAIRMAISALNGEVLK